jgi:outer membrane protein OmpA-like peptidoglycan-associated protein
MLRLIKFNKPFLFVVLMWCGLISIAQTQTRLKPKWWFGESGGVNMNRYRGTTQQLSNNLLIPTAFHKGSGIKPYLSVLTEYRPGKYWGGALNVSYDNRGGKFDAVTAPCNCPANLRTDISYLSVEPSVHLAPFGSAFYVFAGPVISFNVAKSFTYTQEKQVDQTANLSGVRSTIVSVQAGTGIDIPLSSKLATTQMTLSPFAAFVSDLGQQPRNAESWSVYTIRAGLALKFGLAARPILPLEKPASEVVFVPVPAAKEVQFSVRAPKVVPKSRFVKETFPLRNSVFFDMGSNQIPSRYVLLDTAAAAAFHENLLQTNPSISQANGRSARQLAVYHNILNIKGDRLRLNPKSSIALIGSADKNPEEGKLMAENVKQYLVSVFGIEPSRITTKGQAKPNIPSEQPGHTTDLELLKQGDRRVDIESTSPELLLLVGGKSVPFLRPVQLLGAQIDPLDSHVVFTVENAEQLLKYWYVNITDEAGLEQQYGPYTGKKATIPGNIILGNQASGNYKVQLIATTTKGLTVKKESTVSLLQANNAGQEGLRYSILFDFDKIKSIEAYENFLTDVVAPLIADSAMVLVHGHTDIIGEASYNRNLSEQRAGRAQQVLERAVLAMGKSGVKFDVFGFGEDERMSPFENVLVEERFYNRTVIIDIVNNFH